MSDLERYGDYNEYEEDRPRGRGSAVGLIIKLLICAACLCVVGMLGFRIFLFNYYPKEMKRLYYTDALTDYYNSTGGELGALSQSYPYMYDDADEGNFFGDNVIAVREAGELQLSVRYNTAVFERLKEKYGAELNEDSSKFIFTLERNPMEEGGEALPIGELVYNGTDSMVMYRYHKLAFSGIDFGEGDNRVKWIRLRITIDGVDTGEDEYLIPIYHDHAEYNKFDEYEPAKNEVPEQ
ncbi:MAG: hypothetical protein IJW48_04975 [Clostridia bacterium]|nr:hypothetical protein [Clostridia bacterium]